ncbi:DUF3263 domain-containing protein [Rhodococcus koreensis]|uniref:DUF3263 domain-containing protein n=1 Tax=Rhodococcus koreensis TaxID=99653 RepID=A0A1H4RDQ4_9NOCA|nr:DUF3263 domain-containing protein [Rhodococcus koreensis]SEC29938.1 Protein of unknown function [Rhodococcus koreensis]
MDLHEKDMLAFARTWQPYGGNDDQILPEFGISEPTFYQRVLALLARPRTVGLGDEERKALITFCMAKLREYGYPQRDRPGMTRQRAIRHS